MSGLSITIGITVKDVAHLPRSYVSSRIRRTQTVRFASRCRTIRSSDVYHSRFLYFGSRESRSSFPSLDPTVPETWLLCAGPRDVEALKIFVLNEAEKAGEAGLQDEL
jgi:hypothetical protein